MNPEQKKAFQYLTLKILWWPPLSVSRKRNESPKWAYPMMFIFVDGRGDHGKKSTFREGASHTR